MYDELYHDLALKKIFVQKRVLRIVESLALPPEQQSDKKLTSLCQKIHIMKQDIKKEMIKK